MALGERSLIQAVRIEVVAKYLSQLAVVLALLTLAPLVVALVSRDWDASVRYAVIVALLGLPALPALRLPTPTHLQTNEALVVVALAFVISPLVMTYPMMAAGLSFGDALFEAVSGITTTGLTTVADIESRPASFLFARAWMQWYGGLGIAVLSVALLMGHHIAARRLVEPATDESMVTTARSYARRILLVYLALTMLGVVCLWWLLGDAMLATLHVLAGVSTGGFAPLTNSLAAVEGWTLRFAVIALGLCGALPLIAYFRLSQRGWRALVRDVEVRALVIALLVVSAVLAALAIAHAEDATMDAAAHAVLIAISAQTTTGFSSMPISDLDDGSRLVLILAMFTGGSVGSTAGGVKLLRLLILLRLVQLILRRTALPDHAVVQPRLGGRALDDADMQRAMVLVFLFAGTIVVSWLIFVALGHPPFAALFEVVSATATVGLSTGLTGSELHPVLKGVLCADMLLGRLEIVALLVVLYPPTWFGKRGEFR